MTRFSTVALIVSAALLATTLPAYQQMISHSDEIGWLFIFIQFLGSLITATLFFFLLVGLKSLVVWSWRLIAPRPPADFLGDQL